VVERRNKTISAQLPFLSQRVDCVLLQWIYKLRWKVVFRNWHYYFTR